MKRHLFAVILLAVFTSVLSPDCSAQVVRWKPAPPVGETSRHPQAEASCSSDTPLITPLDSVGPIRWDMALEQLAAICEAVEYRWIYLEGEPQPVVVTLLGEVSVVVEFADTLPGTPIYRISTNSESARTVDGVGPGVELLSVARKWPDLKIAFGEGVFALSASHPGISLEIGMPGEWDWDAAQEVRRSGDWSALPKGSYVESVLLLPGYPRHRND